MSRDDQYRKLINSAKWKALRLQHLTARPWCEQCLRQGRRVTATEVHHITPVETAHDMAGKAALCFSPYNLESLCHACHRDAHTALRSLTKAERIRRAKDVRASQIAALFNQTAEGGMVF